MSSPLYDLLLQLSVSDIINDVYIYTYSCMAREIPM